MHLGRIEFIIVLFTDWSFASGCSPPILSFTQLPSATDRPVLLSGRDFHPTVGAYFQAHSSCPFRTKKKSQAALIFAPFSPGFQPREPPPRATRPEGAADRTC
jgi:hypothetical protein